MPASAQGIGVGAGALVGGSSGANAGAGITIGGTGAGVGVGDEIDVGAGVGVPGTPGAPGNLASPCLAGAVANMSDGQLQRTKKRCMDVMADSGGFDSDLIELCKLVQTASR